MCIRDSLRIITIQNNAGIVRVDHTQQHLGLFFLALSDFAGLCLPPLFLPLLLMSLELHRSVRDGCISDAAFLGHAQHRRKNRVEQQLLRREQTSLPKTPLHVEHIRARHHPAARMLAYRRGTGGRRRDGCISDAAFLGHAQHRRKNRAEQQFRWREQTSLPKTLLHVCRCGIGGRLRAFSAACQSELSIGQSTGGLCRRSHGLRWWR